MIDARFHSRPLAAVITDFHSDRSGGAEALVRAGVPVHSSPGVIARLNTAATLEAVSVPVFAGELAGMAIEVFAPGADTRPRIWWFGRAAL